MAPLAVHIKHLGKLHDVQLDPDLPAAVFKDAIYQVTGVPPDRMKVMTKAGVLKDDTEWKKVAPKEGQTFMVVGAAGELPKPPGNPTVFLEDMDDSELASALAKPVGLTNLGNTCYMNASVQALRAIPELQVALAAAASPSPLPKALNELYGNMSRTTEGVTPMGFIQVLRQVNPQFAEFSSNKGGMAGLAGYAQQDAEECYGQIINSLREIRGLPSSSNATDLAESSTSATRPFIEQFMMGEMRRELRCVEAPDEPPTVTTEQALKIECNISITTNYMHTGIMNALDQQVEKNSPSLGRQAIYTQHSRMTRLPAYLTVHMVRFAWRADINKKTKIMRKVKFPLEFDAIDLVTEELKQKLLPVSRKLKEIEKERMERRKVRKRTKAIAEAPATLPETTTIRAAMSVDGESRGIETVPVEVAPVIPVELAPEDTYRSKELAELEALVDPQVGTDVGCSLHGLYDLVAIVTHKGAAADAGHYMGFVKKSVFHAPSGTVASQAGSSSASPVVSSSVALNEDDEDWYKFDDDKVSVFPVEKLATLDGGGQDSSAYVLLYRSKSLA